MKVKRARADSPMKKILCKVQLVKSEMNKSVTSLYPRASLMAIPKANAVPQEQITIELRLLKYSVTRVKYSAILSVFTNSQN